MIKSMRYNKQDGFTLIEFVIAIAVIALIFVAIIPMVSDYWERNQELERVANEDAINTAIRQCYTLEGRYPPVEGETGLSYLEKNYGVILKPRNYIYEYFILDGAPYLTVEIR